MSVTYELLEEFTGSRSSEGPDPDNEGETITTVSEVTDVHVRFTCSETDIVHERHVNVTYTDGEYDAEATAEVMTSVGMGVAHKIAVGVIS